MDATEALGLARTAGIEPEYVIPHQSLGIDNHVWFLGHEWVLRTPRSEETAKYMEIELDIWEFVSGQGLLIPEMAARGHREGGGLPFMIVRRIAGKLLGESDPTASYEGFVDDLVAQLVALHGIRGVDRPEWRRPFDDFDPWPYFRDVWDLKALPRSELLEIEAFMQRLGEHPGNYKGVARPAADGDVLTHNDLHAWNLIVRGENPRLASIIDWGDACVSDRRNDLSTMPLGLQITIAEAYRSVVGDVGPSFEARILWAWLDLSFWEIMNMEKLGFHRPWWRWPVGGWSRAKEILRDAPSGWQV